MPVQSKSKVNCSDLTRARQRVIMPMATCGPFRRKEPSYGPHQDEWHLDRCRWRQDH